MGAQTSTSFPASQLEWKALRQDSRGEPIVPYAEALEFEAAGLARIAELENELAQVNGKLEAKEEELNLTQRLLSKLEGAVEQQAKDSELEQHRIERMEESLARQQSGTEEKVAKLLLAVAGEKQRAEIAERARDEAMQRSSSETELQEMVQELRKSLDQERSRRESAEARAARKEQLVAELEQKLQLAGNQSQQLANTQSLAEQLQKEEILRRAAEENLKQKEKLVADLNQRLQDAQQSDQKLAAQQTRFAVEANRKVSDLEEQLRQLKESQAANPPERESNQMVQELQQQFAEEVAKRMDVQNRLLEKDRRLREAQEEIARTTVTVVTTADSPNLAEQMSILQTQLSEQDSKRAAIEGRLKEKEAALARLQHVLADELKSRMAAQQQVVEKEKQIASMHASADCDDHAKQQLLQAQVISKTREACGLAQQLADELGKRQEVQYQLLQKERAMCQLQEQVLIMERSHLVNQSPIAGSIVVDLPSFQESEMRLDEPDDEKSPRNHNEDDTDCRPPLTLASSTLGSGLPHTTFKRSGSIGQMAWQQTPGVAVSHSGEGIYRANSGSQFMETFIRKFTPPAVVPPAQPGGEPGRTAALRTRFYSGNRGVQGSPMSHVYDKLASGATTPLDAVPDRHSRRLQMASRTFA